MIAADEIPLEIARMGLGDVYRLPIVKEWLRVAEATDECQQLKAFVENRINSMRRNEGRDHLSTSVFTLLELSERHCYTKTDYRKLVSLQRKAAKRLGVPVNEGSLPWMIAATN